MNKDPKGGGRKVQNKAEATDSHLRAELKRLRTENRLLAEQLRAYESVCREFSSDSGLFLSGPVVMFKWKNAPGWPVGYVSPNVESLMGFNVEEFILGRVAFADIIHPEDLPRVSDELMKHGAGDSPSFTHQPYRIRKKDGQQIWILDHTAFIREKDGSVGWFVGYLMDISDRMHFEQRLKESEDRWQFALEGNRDGVWDWNTQTNRVFFSRHWKEMLGFEDHEITDTLEEWKSRVHPKDKEQVQKDLADHLAGRTRFYENTHRMRCKDGTWKWIFDRGKVVARTRDGKPLRVIGTHTDVTQIKNVEEELRTSRANLRMAQTLAKIGNWSWTRKDNTIVCSREIYRIFERDPDDEPLTYAEFLAHLHPDDGPAVRSAPPPPPPPPLKKP